MPIFHYSGYRNDGSSVTGTLDAEGRRSAIEKLKDQGILAVRVEPGASAGAPDRGRGLSERLPLVTRNLATLIASGVPVVEALEGLLADEQGPWRTVLMDVKERVRSGSALAPALEAHPSIFPDFYTGMVSAGEASGTLDTILRRLADFLESSAALRARVRTAMIYPLFMLVVSAGVLSFLLSFVVPKIARVFENTGASLPLLTRLLLGLSRFLQSWWWLILLAGAALFWLGRRYLAARRERAHAALLGLPVIGPLLGRLNTARFARTLGLLLDGGLPILRAIRLAAASMGNLHLRRRTEALADRIVEGASLAAAMKEVGVFPRSLVTLVATGEKSGRLGEILGQAADAFESDFDRAVSRAVALFEPALIVGMGVAVGVIVVSILLPIFQMNQLIR